MKTYQFYDQTLKFPDVDVEELRRKLHGKTWEDFVSFPHSNVGVDNIIFTARMGRFMNRPTLAIMALNRFVVICHPKTEYPNSFIWSKVLSDNHSGFAIQRSDFAQRFVGIKLTDLVIPDEDGA